MKNDSFKQTNYIIRCLASFGLILFGITLMRGQSDASGIPVIMGALAIGAGALTLIISLVAWFFSATNREDTIAGVPTRGRPAAANEPVPVPRKRTVWGPFAKLFTGGGECSC